MEYQKRSDERWLAKPFGSDWSWLIVTAFSLGHAFIVTAVYAFVPQPYMDEIFHVNQTRRYCELDFSWNEKITTPPALYFLSLLGFCGRERYLNSALIPFALFGAMRFRGLVGERQVVSTAVLVMLLPVLFHSSLLFYTDLLSLTVLLWAFSCSTPHFASALFFVAVLTRQTNIVWAAVYGAIQLSKGIDVNRVIPSALSTLKHLWSLLVLAALFLIFLVWNGGTVVLGDHSAHNPVPHFMQLYYFLLFVCFSAAPSLLLSRRRMLDVLREVVNSPVLNLISVALISICVRLFTFEHPYLLADNRHFTFYVWRRWFRFHWACRYLLVPVYLLAAHFVKQSVSVFPRLVQALFVLGTVAVLVPVHLLEPRYFIAPFVFWRLTLKEVSSYTLLMELIFACLLNVFVLYLFLLKPFEWSHEPGEQQRFMW